MFCNKCERQIDDTISACPNCGSDLIKAEGNVEDFTSEKKGRKTPIYKKWWFWVIIVVASLAIISGENDETEQNDNNDGNNSGEVNDGDSDQPSITMEEKNALASARNYLRTMPFSYNGLIEQLEFEGYSNKAAKYAVDNCGANWNEQAKKMAKNYLDIMPFSKNELIEQLEFEGFTYEQAVYGVEANGYE